MSEGTDWIVQYFGGGAEGFWGFAGDTASFGQSWADTFWLGFWAVWFVVAFAVVAGWLADVMEESTMKKTLAFGGVVFAVMITGVLGAISHIYEGYLFCYFLPAGIAYALVFEFDMGKSGVYASIFALVVIQILAWIIPGIFGDLFGVLNWKNWGMWLGMDVQGPGIYDSVWGAKSGEVIEGLQEALGGLAG